MWLLILGGCCSCVCAGHSYIAFAFMALSSIFVLIGLLFLLGCRYGFVIAFALTAVKIAVLTVVGCFALFPQTTFENYKTCLFVLNVVFTAIIYVVLAISLFKLSGKRVKVCFLAPPSYIVLCLCALFTYTENTALCIIGIIVSLVSAVGVFCSLNFSRLYFWKDDNVSHINKTHPAACAALALFVVISLVAYPAAGIYSTNYIPGYRQLDRVDISEKEEYVENIAKILSGDYNEGKSILNNLRGDDLAILSGAVAAEYKKAYEEFADISVTLYKMLFCLADNCYVHLSCYRFKNVKNTRIVQYKFSPSFGYTASESGLSVKYFDFFIKEGIRYEFLTDYFAKQNVYGNGHTFKLISGVEEQLYYVLIPFVVDGTAFQLHEQFIVQKTVAPSFDGYFFENNSFGGGAYDGNAWNNPVYTVSTWKL